MATHRTGTMRRMVLAVAFWALCAFTWQTVDKGGVIGIASTAVQTWGGVVWWSPWLPCAVFGGAI